MKTQNRVDLVAVCASGLAASLVAAGIGCAPPPAVLPAAPVAVHVDAERLPADGLASTTVTAHLDPGTHPWLADVTVAFTSTGGLLSSSAATFDDHGDARVTLFADQERALLGRAEKPVTVRATVTRSLQEKLTGTASLVFEAPTSGAPYVTIEAAPPVAIANGSDVVLLTVRARRVEPGTVVTLASTAGALAADALTLEDDGADGVVAHTEISAPDAPASALVTASEPSGAFGTITVEFVADGAPQFDLTGTFAQASPARIKMTSGSLSPNPQCIAAPSFIKVTLVQEGDVVHAEYETCFVTLAPVHSIVGDVTNEAPPAFVSAIPRVTDDVVLTDRALGAPFDPHASVVVSGAVLDDPDDDLPTDPEDERVRDSDGDGEPGITVINTIGDHTSNQNITFRNTGDTKGRVESASRIVGDTPGDLTALPESSVLGPGNGFLPDFTTLPSVWEMLRVDGAYGSPDMDTNGDGEVTCNEIVDAQEFLFTIEAPATPLDCEGA